MTTRPPIPAQVVGFVLFCLVLAAASGSIAALTIRALTITACTPAER